MRYIKTYVFEGVNENDRRKLIGLATALDCEFEDRRRGYGAIVIYVKKKKLNQFVGFAMMLYPDGHELILNEKLSYDTKEVITIWHKE